MPELEEDTVVISPEDIEDEVTPDQVKDHPELGPNPATANDGVLDDADYENPESEDQVIEAIAELLLGPVVGGGC